MRALIHPHPQTRKITAKRSRHDAPNRFGCLTLGFGCFDTLTPRPAGSAACKEREDDLRRRQVEHAIRTPDT